MQNRDAIEDERFFTPRAQASTSRSAASYGTPRSAVSSDMPSSRSSVDDHSYVGEETLRRCGLSKNLHYVVRQNNVCAKNETHAARLPMTYSAHSYNDSEIDYRESSALDLDTNKSYFKLNGGIKCRNDSEDIFSLARHGRAAELDSLLRMGINVNSQDENGNTILTIACQNGNKKILKVALRYGANLNLSNARGNTALHFCFKYGFGDSLGAYLISKGADTTRQNADMQTCFELGY